MRVRNWTLVSVRQQDDGASRSGESFERGSSLGDAINTKVSIGTIVQWICLPASGLIRTVLAFESIGSAKCTIRDQGEIAMSLENALNTAKVYAAGGWKEIFMKHRLLRLVFVALLTALASPSPV